MSIRSAISIILVSLLLMTACARKNVQAPKDVVPKISKLHSYPYGGYIEISDSEGQHLLNGELIGFKADSIFVLKEQMLVGLKRTEISKARVIIFKSDYADVLLLNFLNLPLSLSNGIIAIFTLPLNIIIGSSVMLAEIERENYLDYPEHTWEEIQKFSRFPQGLLDSIDRDSIRGKVPTTTDKQTP